MTKSAKPSPNFALAIHLTLLLICAPLWGQDRLRTGVQGHRAAQTFRKPKLDPKRQFVVDVVNTAVGLPQSDPMDRLRVLAAASRVLTPIEPAKAKRLSAEGLRIEQEAIQEGQVPPESMIEAGAVDCVAVRSLAENVPVARIDAAEKTLVAAVGRCPGTLLGIERLITAGLEKNVVAPRLTMTTAEQAGAGSDWSRKTVGALFASLSSADKRVAKQAPELAALYSQMVDAMSEDEASRAGVELLGWLSQLNASKQRNLAVNVANDGMKHRLGGEKYARALGSDAGAMLVAGTAGQQGQVELASEQSVSVLKAMESSDTDRSDELETMSPAKRAREAAASGFAAGSSRDARRAQHYFDIAFQAVEEVWRNREREKDAAEIVQEVSEAAAQVSPTEALARTQRLQDPPAQAIGMIAVARVAANR